MNNIIHPVKGRPITIGDISGHLIKRGTDPARVLPIWMGLSVLRKFVKGFDGRARLSLEHVLVQEVTMGFPSVQLKIYMDDLSICKMMIQATDEKDIKIYLQGCEHPALLWTPISFGAIPPLNVFLNCLFDDPIVNFIDFHEIISNLPYNEIYTDKNRLINAILMSGATPDGIYKSTFPL